MALQWLEIVIPSLHYCMDRIRPSIGIKSIDCLMALVSDDFIISRMTFQARYRWEIAPLSDLFVVYTRGSNIPGTMYEDYGSLLSEAWSEPIVDTIVVKLRYGLGS